MSSTGSKVSEDIWKYNVGESENHKSCVISDAINLTFVISLGQILEITCSPVANIVKMGSSEHHCYYLSLYHSQ